MFDRLVGLDELLRSRRPVPMNSLTSRFECTAATIRRDFTRLQERYNVEIDYDAEIGGYRYREGGIDLPQHFTIDDAHALFVAIPILEKYAGTSLGSNFRDALDQLAGHLPPNARKRLERITTRVRAKSLDIAAQDPDKFAQLLEATLEDETVEITYKTTVHSTTSSRAIDPYCLMEFPGGWYVLAHCHVRKRVLAFKTDRMWSITRTGKSFERPDDFDPDRLLAHSMGPFVPEADAEPTKVVIWFDELARRWVREIGWHSSQKITNAPGGGIRMTLHLTNFVEVTRLVLSWGERAEILEPEHLRAQVAKQLKEAAARYATKR